MLRLAVTVALLLASAPLLAQPSAPRSTNEGIELFQQGQAAEQNGKVPEAMKLYVRAAQAGNGQAAMRLAEIYDKGAPGVARDYAESLKWYNAARMLGGGPPLIGDFPRGGGYQPR